MGMTKIAYVIALLTLAASASPSVPCSAVVKHSNIKKAYSYDLSELYRRSGEPDFLYYYDDVNNAIISVNICGVSSLSCLGPAKSAACGFIGQDSVSFGSLDKQTFSVYNGVEPGQGVNVTYSEGTSCSYGGKHSVHVLIKCSDGEESFAYKADSDSADACEANLYVYSKTGCGSPAKYSSGGMGAGGIILIILAVLVVLYFGLGAVYQWKFKEAQTIPEFIIHREFWVSIPGLVKDGVLFIAHGFKKGDYTSL